MIRRLLALAALAGVLVGGVLSLLGKTGAADVVWAASTALMLVPLTWSVARTLWRRTSASMRSRWLRWRRRLRRASIWPARLSP